MFTIRIYFSYRLFLKLKLDYLFENGPILNVLNNMTFVLLKFTLFFREVSHKWNPKQIGEHLLLKS